MTLGSPILSIGSADQVGPTVFGEITGVAADRNGNVYVLDRTTHSVRAFSSRGNFLGSAGRAGRGPGELSLPQTVFHDGAKTLFVTDLANGMVGYETRDGALSYRENVATQFVPNSACALREKLIINVLRDQKILHLFDRDGQHLSSFGEGFSRDTSEAVRRVANRMMVRLNCDSTLNRIFVAPVALGEVRAYDGAGHLVWQQRLEGFLGNRVMLTSQGVVTVSGRHSTGSLLRIGADLLLLQVRHREPVNSSAVNARGARGYWEDRAVITYVLSARSGEVLTRTIGPPLLGAVTPEFFVAYEDDPFPRVMLLPWRAVGR